jgi:tetratricopeptide (TPR) repeat protein
MSCIYTAFVFLALLANPQKAVADEGIAILTGITGGVETARAGETSWRQAEVGLSLDTGDRLRTGEGAKATVLLSDGRTFSVLPNSVVNISTEMPGQKGFSSGLGNVMRVLWSALVGKFNESRDISVTKGVVGTIRGPKKALVDAELSEDQERNLAQQVAEVEAMDIDAVSQHLIFAVLYEEAKQYARAEEHYSKAIELNPTEGRLYDTLGSLYARLGQKEKFYELKAQKAKVVAEHGDEGSR